MPDEILRLGPLQLRIMQTLWSSDRPLSVAEVRRALGGAALAYTTVATMLRKMEQRDLVTHQEHGRKFLYAAAVSSEDVSRSAAEQYVEQVFRGDLSAAVSNLLETREVDRQELAELERMIRERRQARGG